MFLADRPFGFAGGTEFTVRLEHASNYARHTLGRVRVRVARASEALLARLPLAFGTWHVVGPFPANSRKDAFEHVFGPELDAALDPARPFGTPELRWRAGSTLLDGVPHTLPSGVVATYVGRRVYAPSARDAALSLGSDDGFRLFVDGHEVASRDVERALAADQDQALVAVPRGSSTLVLKDVNTGGRGGFYFRAEPGAMELAGLLVAGLLPLDTRPSAIESRLALAWRLQRSSTARAARGRTAVFEARATALEAELPRTMVMKELGVPRPTYVLRRGQYDEPDLDRPVQRTVPAALGRLADDAPADRLGLARWMLASDNPLVARVAANRMFEQVFGSGLVRTGEDFGLQGEWPSHPELLDWLAVRLRDSGWNSREILWLLVTSATYRQSAQRRVDLVERDPENRLLASFPRTRLPAEAIRALALYTSGLLVEELGGRSVKPYQPDGLWQEVAMPASNTRADERGSGTDLWRRSLYTYWKRASPPPTLAAFDAPTRESSTIRRASTNTPLQALALWNDPQFVEAARVLAMRTLREKTGGSTTAVESGRTIDDERFGRLAQRVTGRALDKDEIAALHAALAQFRTRYQADPEDARKLLSVGDAPLDMGLDPSELAAWTLVASAVLSLDAAITRQ